MQLENLEQNNTYNDQTMYRDGTPINKYMAVFIRKMVSTSSAFSDLIIFAVMLSVFNPNEP